MSESRNHKRQPVRVGERGAEAAHAVIAEFTSAAEPAASAGCSTERYWPRAEHPGPAERAAKRGAAECTPGQRQQRAAADGPTDGIGGDPALCAKLLSGNHANPLKTAKPKVPNFGPDQMVAARKLVTKTKPKAYDAAKSFTDFLAASPGVDVIEQNSLGIAVPMRAKLGAALNEIMHTLAG